ncbi:hypothetical protein ACFQW4_02600 [Pantoea sp. GCM10028869]|uniref:hypothetical protein n=1 Tax=Pantoea sp. GCM10028869 TaxID=3273417 RepID=UPI003606EE89
MIIAIEGIDGSGKNTQTEVLLSKLINEGFDASKMGFPCYESTFFGQEVANYLNGKFGSLSEVPAKFSSLLYAGDRFEKKHEIIEKSSNNKILVIDRYVASNIAHQTAKLYDEDREILKKWIEHLEYHVYGLPKPDVCILLNLDVSTSSELVLKKEARNYTSKNKDLHEEDDNYLSKVAVVYKELAMESDYWNTIECLDNGILRSIEDISEEIYEKVNRFIK